MTKILQFYNYDKALAYYEDQLMHIHQAPVKQSGFKAVAKPVLLPLRPAVRGYAS